MRHRFSYTKTYRAWINMRTRCENPNTKYYYRYGGRGIRVWPAWQSSFAQFLFDMGEKPEGTSLDRIDTNGNYEPTNCRWATPTLQQRNRKGNRIVTVNGESMTLADAVERRGLKYNTVLYRLKRGKSIEDALR